MIFCRNRLLASISLVTAGFLLLSAATTARAASGCAAVPAADEARSAGDLDAISVLIAGLSAAGCSPGEQTLVKLQAATAFYEKASADGIDDEERIKLLQRGLDLSQPDTPWKLLAWLGDLQLQRRNFAMAAKLYSDALDTIRDEQATPTAPSKKIIAAIFKKAEQSALLATSVVPQANKRTGGPGGVAVETTRGFTVKKVARPVQFVFRETAFTDMGREAARELLNEVRSYQQIRLIGHTDAKGDRAFNQKLSVQRARAVADFLKANGYAGRILVAGKGEDEPFSGDGSLALTEDETDQQNRRVELERLNTASAGVGSSQ